MGLLRALPRRLPYYQMLGYDKGASHPVYETWHMPVLILTKYAQKSGSRGCAADNKCRLSRIEGMREGAAVGRPEPGHERGGR